MAAQRILIAGSRRVCNAREDGRGARDILARA